MYYDRSFVDSFPYHGLMLYLLAPFAYIGTIFGDNESIIKIPLLLADLAILFFLVKIGILNNHFYLIYVKIYFLLPVSCINFSKYFIML